MAIDWNKIIIVSDERTVDAICGKEILYVRGGGGGGGGGGGVITSGEKTSGDGMNEEFTLNYSNGLSFPVLIRNGELIYSNGEIYKNKNGLTSFPIFLGYGPTLTSFTADIVAYQAGSGDPAPSNPRIFYGTSKFDEYWRSTGKNLLTEPYPTDGDWEHIATNLGAVVNDDKSITLQPAFIPTGSQDGAIYYDVALPAGTYYLAGAQPETTSSKICATISIHNNRGSDPDHGLIATDTDGTGTQFTLAGSRDSLQVKINIRGITEGEAVTMYPMLCRADEEDKSYTAPQGWGYQDLGFGETIYGGNIDLLANTITVTHGHIASYAGETLPGAWLSSIDKYVEGTTPSVGAEVVYELAEPYTLTLDDFPEIIQGIGMDVINLKLDYPCFKNLIVTGVKSYLPVELIKEVRPDAPDDGDAYAKKYEEWVKISSMAFADDVLDDGRYYLRKHDDWEYIPIQTRAHKDYYVDAVNGDSGNDGSQANPLKSLQAAIDLGSASPYGRINIYIAEGSYSGTGTEELIFRGQKYYNLTLMGDIEIEGLSVYDSTNVSINISVNGNTITSTDQIDVIGNSQLYLGPGSELIVTGASINVNRGSSFICAGNLTLTNPSSNGLWLSDGSFAYVNSADITAGWGYISEGSIIIYNALTGTMDFETTERYGGKIFTVGSDGLQSYATPTYYVSYTQGSDTNDGTSARPFKTIQKAVDLCPTYGQGTIIATANQAENVTIKQKNIVLEFKEDVWGTGKLTGDLTVKDKAAVIVKASTISYFEVEGSITVQNDSSIVQSGNQVKVTSGRISVENSKFSAATVSITYNTSGGVGITATGSSLVSLALGNITAPTGVLARNGAIITASALFGTMTTPSMQDSGGKVFIGSSSGSAEWGDIGGILSNQTDLYNALNSKANTADLGTMASVDDAPSNGNEYVRKNGAWAVSSGGGGGGSSSWGSITGDIEDQTDLASALADKADASDVYDKTTINSALADKADADDVYTKTEADALLADKADTADLGDLAFEDAVDYSDVQNTPTLGTLASKNSVDYSTDVTNKPTLGALASKNTADYSTDVTNKPTLGALSALDSIDYTGNLITNKPTLGDLASQDTVDYTTDITNKPTLGSLAALSSIDYTSNLLTNKPTLGDLAYEDSVDYSDVTNTPTLGSLAAKNSADYATDVTNKPTLGTMSAVNDAPSDGSEYVRKNGAWSVSSGGGGGASAWGSITGTLSDQTDLQDALDAKADTVDLGALADHDTVDYSTEVTNKPTLGGIQVRQDYTISSTDLTAGTSSLETGKLYFYYT